MTQLQYQGEMDYQGSIELEMIAGNRRDYIFLHPDVNAAEISLAQFVASNGSNEVEISSDALPAQVTIADGQTTITWLNADTAGLSGSFPFQFKLTLTSGAEFTPIPGTLKITADLIDDAAVASYLSRVKRSEFDALLVLEQAVQANVMSAANITQLTSAAASGASTITVDSVAQLTAGDTIIVVLDSGAYDEHNIAAGGITGYVVTLDATTLSGDAAAGNIVQRVG